MARKSACSCRSSQLLPRSPSSGGCPLRFNSQLRGHLLIRKALCKRAGVWGVDKIAHIHGVGMRVRRIQRERVNECVLREGEGKG